MTVFYCFVENRLILITFFSDQFISHRSDFLIKTRSFLEDLGTAKHNFVYGQYHAPSLQSKYILTTVGISGIIMLYKKILNIRYILILCLIGVFSIIYGFWEWDGLEQIRKKYFIFKAFNFSRFYWLHPLLWYTLFYISLITILKYIRKSIIFIYLVIFLQLFLVFNNHEQIVHKKSFTFNQFFAQKQMRAIKTHIKKPQDTYKVVSLGMHLSIAQNSGFYTLDGYYSNYP